MENSVNEQKILIIIFCFWGDSITQCGGFSFGLLLGMKISDTIGDGNDQKLKA
jgi:hypothetical protein